MHSFIGKLDIFPLMCAADKVWITELKPWSAKILGQFITRMRKFISQSDVKHIMTSPIKMITSVYKVSKHITTSITARPIRLTAILLIMSVSTFKTTVILYLSVRNPLQDITSTYNPWEMLKKIMF